jgi:hypothetical protein
MNASLEDTQIFHSTAIGLIFNLSDLKAVVGMFTRRNKKK